MNKKDLAKEMSRRHSMTTEEAMVRGEDVRVSGFGVFRIIDRAARTAHNPVTGEPVEVPRHKGIMFRPSSSLSRKIKASEEV